MSSLLSGALALIALLALLIGSAAGAGTVAAVPAAQADAESMAELVARAQAGASIAGPSSGVLIQAPDRVTFAAAGVAVRDFYARVRFTNPTDSAGEPWDIGLGFRDGGGREQYRLILDASSVWYLAARGSADQGGSPIPGFAAEPGAENLIELVVAGDGAYFSVNGVFVAALDVSAIGAVGEVWVGTAFRDVTTVEGARTPYAEFEVWSLDAAAPAAVAGAAGATPVPAATPSTEPDPAAAGAEFERRRQEARAGSSVAGPRGGELVQAVGEAAIVVAGVDVRDFYARARFASPSDPDAAGWDYGLVFRDQGGRDQYRLIVDSTGSWYLSIGPETAFAAGSAVGLNLEPDGLNTLELVADGTVGYFSVNGQFVAQLDLSRIVDSGDVWIGTAFFAEDTAEGAVTRYRDFEVWPLARDEPATPVADESTAGAAPLVFRIEERGGSGVSGLAVLYEVEGETGVEVTVIGASGEEVVQLVRGTCDALDPEPAASLAPLDSAIRSETLVGVDRAELLQTPQAVVLRRSADDLATIVACGDFAGR